ncbi:DUF3540 domain-containing protein [Cocleimonas sp. KMM 6892]|uniref:DUF3540 domain-containing protein n=1 Tax=unclassified Cocleimonas TaxID=2639732 RepID=UPI002DBD6935|nr:MULTISPECIES: DUF3540 domain-containing protein [unclassified Cocleimonas]MEB8434451.1 DUF3540 domain-containing protein [Cocleimonas sp. KMM 6892]MEC4717344.1 DUF3540 domain-containing protein [Cocleimonas sp. KMM 6895]MEC4746723.1 DUF3540 domain-containing protein [Cocleimonas sp. KMM 6896]
MKIQELPLKPEKESQIYRVFAEIDFCEDDGTYQVLSEDGVINKVQKAIGCVIEPLKGDKVLIEAEIGGKAYITNVLERSVSEISTIKVQGGLKLRVEGGGLQVQSENGIDFTTLKTMSITSEQMDIRAEESNIYFSKLSYMGKSLISKLETMSIFGGLMNFIMDTVVQKSKTSHRVIEDSEYVKSRHINYQAQHIMQMHGKNTLLTAEELVKLDGDQIHLG